MKTLLLPINMCLIYLCPLTTNGKKAKFHFSLWLLCYDILACFRVKCWFLFLLLSKNILGSDFMAISKEILCHYGLLQGHGQFCSSVLPLQFDKHSALCIMSVKGCLSVTLSGLYITLSTVVVQ